MSLTDKQIKTLNPSHCDQWVADVQGLRFADQAQQIQRYISLPLHGRMTSAEDIRQICAEAVATLRQWG
jgi:hypothetical protein